MKKSFIFFFSISILIFFTGCKQDVPANKHTKDLEKPKEFSFFEKLSMPYSQISKQIGAHHLKAHAHLTRHLPNIEPEQIEIDVSIQMDKSGQIHAIKNTSPQYGLEVIWAKEKLYTRQRYSHFTVRPDKNGKPLQMVGEMYGLLPAYLDLLKGFFQIQTKNTQNYQNREGESVSLVLSRKSNIPSQQTSPDKRWRNTLNVTKIKGSAFIDKQTNVPFRVSLLASWNFALPKKQNKKTGIPLGFDHRMLGTVDLKFSQTIDTKSQNITAPPIESQVIQLKRHRQEIERQMLLGERPIPKDWEPLTR